MRTYTFTFRTNQGTQSFRCSARSAEQAARYFIEQRDLSEIVTGGHIELINIESEVTA